MKSTAPHQRLRPESSHQPGLRCGWDITHACNYRCRYCFFLSSWEIDGPKTSRRHLACAREDLLRFWDKVYRRYGSVRIEIAGGEPFNRQDLLPMIGEISKRHTVRIVTNLAVETDEIIRNLDPASVGFSASFHPDHAGLEGFIAKLRRLRDAGFEAIASVVAFPPNLGALEGWGREFEKAGICLYVNPFQGVYEGRSYPKSYAEEEKKLLCLRLFPDPLEYRLGRRSPNGSLCAAGKSYFRIWPDGRIFRCCGATEVGEKPLGHIRDSDFELLSEAAPCPAGRCFAPNEITNLL